MKNSYVERDDEDWLELSKRWIEVSQQLNELKEEYNFLKDQLISLSDDQSCKGGGVRLLRGMRKGVVQYKEIPELQYVDLEKYRKPSAVSWTITAERHPIKEEV